MEELVGGASLLLAALALVYSTWYGEIQGEIQRRVAEQEADASGPIVEMRAVLLQRAVPLAIGASVSTLVLLPETVEVVVETINLVSHDLSGALAEYDALSAVLVLLNLGLALFALHLIGQAVALRAAINNAKANLRS